MATAASAARQQSGERCGTAALGREEAAAPRHTGCHGQAKGLETACSHAATELCSLGSGLKKPSAG